MDALEQREEGFEKRFAMQEEFRFRALARRNWRLCHVWTYMDPARLDWSKSNAWYPVRGESCHTKTPQWTTALLKIL